MDYFDYSVTKYEQHVPLSLECLAKGQKQCLDEGTKEVKDVGPLTDEEAIAEITTSTENIINIAKEVKFLLRYKEFFNSDFVLFNVLKRGGIENAEKKGNKRYHYRYIDNGQIAATLFQREQKLCVAFGALIMTILSMLLFLPMVTDNPTFLSVLIFIGMIMVPGAVIGALIPLFIILWLRYVKEPKLRKQRQNDAKVYIPKIDELAQEMIDTIVFLTLYRGIIVEDKEFDNLHCNESDWIETLLDEEEEFLIETPALTVEEKIQNTTHSAEECMEIKIFYDVREKTRFIDKLMHSAKMEKQKICHARDEAARANVLVKEAIDEIDRKAKQQEASRAEAEKRKKKWEAEEEESQRRQDIWEAEQVHERQFIRDLSREINKRY
ncbi:MAG: hypothetical protein R3Y23_03820 [Bacillota bacterium]